MIKAIKLVLKEGTTFDLYFLNGAIKRYDVLNLSDKFPQLNELKNRELFLKGKLLGWGGVVWNDKLDISSETVYEDGEDVTLEYNDIPQVVIGYRIKEKRIELNLSQQELAHKVGIDQSDLSKIEKGNANPSLKMLSRIFEGLKSDSAKEEIEMINKSITDAKHELETLADYCIKSDDAVRINIDSGSVILMSEKAYRNMKESFYLLSISGIKDDIDNTIKTSSNKFTKKAPWEK